MNPVDQTIVEPTIEASQAKDIREILYRRSDLSTFIVHLTRNENGQSAKDRLKSIINDWTIEAKSPMGSAVDKLSKQNGDADSQRCVCFTETPLEYLYLMIGEIKGRKCQLSSYGIAMTKMLARKKGINPVWYTDITPGHDWLMKEIEQLIKKAIESGYFEDSPIAKIAPFIEQMGTKRTGDRIDYRKEFWWEREWRHVGDFELPDHLIILCPDENNNHNEFEGLAKDSGHSAKCIDPDWGLEKIIARLAGFKNGQIDIL